MTKNWSPKDVDRFKDLWANGASTEDCARALQRTYYAIERARIRFRLPKRDAKNRRYTPAGKPHSKSGPAVGEFSTAMKRETDAQAAAWERLLTFAFRKQVGI